MAADGTFLAFFLDEAADILSGWERACLELEQSGQREAVESLYRAAHNLKSGSAAVELIDFSHYVHRIEDLIAKILSGKVPASPQLMHLLLEAQSVLTTWLMTVSTGEAFLPNDAKAENERAIEAMINSDGARPQAETTEAAEAPVPSAEVSVTPTEAAPVPTQTQQSMTTSPATSAPEHHGAEVAASSSKAAASAQSRPTESLRVAASKLDMLIQLVGELSTQQAIMWHGRQIGQLQSKSCDTAIQLIQKNSKDLQGLAMSLRMQPLQSLFQRLERAARDLARAQKKQVEIVCVGDHVELDRSVIERITEAMMHIVRNAVDHGIETPEQRVSEGKTPVATLTFEGAQEPGGVMISVSEDGRGLNQEKVLKKAIEKGLAHADQTYTTAEIQRFIFLPGFSTAEKVTDVSGRGVGMDVVKNAVESIGGGISVASTQGRGTGFFLSLPTTLSIVDALIVEVGADRYAVPVQDVSEIVDLTSFRLETASSRGRLLYLRKAIVPVERLSDHLPSVRAGASAATISVKDAAGSIKPALVVRAGGHHIAFEVSRIASQQPVSLRRLPVGLDRVPGYTGGCILGEGDPCVIVSLPRLMRRHLERIGTNDAADTGASDDFHGVQTDREPGESRHVLFQLRDFTLAAPILSVREIISEIPCERVLGGPAHVAGCIDLRGQFLTVIDLGALLGLSPIEADGPMLVVEVGDHMFALVVDRVEAVADLATDTPTPEAEMPWSGGANVRGVTTLARFRERIIAVIDFHEALAETHPSVPVATDGSGSKAQDLGRAV